MIGLIFDAYIRVPQELIYKSYYYTKGENSLPMCLYLMKVNRRNLGFVQHSGKVYTFDYMAKNESEAMTYVINQGMVISMMRQRQFRELYERHLAYFENRERISNDFNAAMGDFIMTFTPIQDICKLIMRTIHNIEAMYNSTHVIYTDKDNHLQHFILEKNGWDVTMEHGEITIVVTSDGARELFRYLKYDGSYVPKIL